MQALDACFFMGVRRTSQSAERLERSERLSTTKSLFKWSNGLEKLRRSWSLACHRVGLIYIQGWIIYIIEANLSPESVQICFHQHSRDERRISSSTICLHFRISSVHTTQAMDKPSSLSKPTKPPIKSSWIEYPAHDLFLHTIPTITATCDQVSAWLMRWETGGHPTEPEKVGTMTNGRVDGVRLRRLTQGAWEVYLLRSGWDKIAARLCAVDIERAKVLEREQVVGDTPVVELKGADQKS